jgi:hypothetical protein
MIKRLKYIPLLATAMCLATGCKKEYLDINKNPNEPTASSVTSSLILPYALHIAGAQVTAYTWLSNWMGYTSSSGSFSPVKEESTYNLTTGFGLGRWNNLYDMLFDFHNVETRGRAEGIPFHVGIAKVMKARYFQDLVDMFGNVPYSEAFQLSKYATPKYDKAEDIYSDLQVQLDSAISIFKDDPVPAASAALDIMFHGHAEDWILFANTLKLRLLIRQSEVPGFSPTAELAKIEANGGVLKSGQSASVNPGYSNSTSKQNPYYASYGFTVSGTQATERVRANNYMLGLLKGASDPRLSRYYRPASNPVSATDPYIGTTYGSPPNDLYNGQRTATIGPGLAGSASQNQWVLTSVESLFLLAEAVARGWLPGNAQTAYENAVRESFIWLGVPNAVAAANTYMANNPSADWANAGGSVAERVRFIVSEKYKAVVAINSLEAWSDYRRLGVPTNLPLSVDPGRVGPGLPVRLLYPTNEFAVNSTNVGAEGSVNHFTSRIFWDR